MPKNKKSVKKLLLNSKRILLHNSYEIPADRWAKEISNPDKTIVKCRFDYSQEYGLYTYFEGAKYPINGIPSEPAVYAICLIKRIIFNSIKFAKKFPYLLILFLIPPIKKYVWQLFLELAQITLHPYFLQEKKYCPSGRELYRAGTKALPQHKDLIEIIIMLWEFDDAYRYRGQDILAEYNKNNDLKKEIKRLLSIFKKRDLNEGGAKIRITYLFSAIKILLLFPKIKKKIKAVLDEIDLSKIQLDIYDKYFSYQFIGYDFKDLSREERMRIRAEL